MKRLFILLVAGAAVIPFATANGGTNLAAKTSAICHRTTSAAKPYVKLRVTAKALKAHGRHAADIIPAPKGACPRTVLSPSRGGVTASVSLTGEAEAPAGDPVGTGTATFHLRLGQGQVCYQLTAQNITPPAAGAHIHRGASGVSGPIVVQLRAPDSSGSSSGCVSVARTLVRALLSAPSNYYVNVHTTDFPGGAIRGQLAGTSATSLGRTFALEMRGTNEPSKGDPDGTGTAIIRIRRADSMVCYRLTVQNVALPSVGAHIHRAAAGANGPIVIPFQAPGASGVSAACTTADGALLDEILANPAGFYVNVHTTESPGGAVRAQLG